MDDKKIVQLLQEGKRSQAFLKLYSGYPPIEKLILSKGGSKEDAKDVFQEALVVFYQKAKKSEFILTASISTYLYSVCRFIWKDELIKRNKREFIDFDIELEDADKEELLEVLEKESKFKLVEEVLAHIGEKCLKLLSSFYYNNLSMKEIASRFELKSENVAKNQKYKCLERAKLKLIELKQNK